MENSQYTFLQICFQEEEVVVGTYEIVQMKKNTILQHQNL